MSFLWFGQKDAPLKKHKAAKIGLALGGGATRGFAHVGAIKAFEEAGIKFDFVAGTSAGSIVGAFYCAGLSFEQIYEKAKVMRKKDIVNKKLFFMPSKTTGLENTILDAIGNKNFSELKTPLAVVAVDLISGEEVVLTKGRVVKAVAGSCAVPGYFTPVEYEHMHLVDGGLQNNIPADVPRQFDCDYVITVDVNSTRGEGTDSLKLTEILLASLRIMIKGSSVKGYINSDVVIQPNMKRFKSTKVDELEQMIEEGYMATKEKMPEILEIISKKPRRNDEGQQKNKITQSYYKSRLL